MLACRLLTPAGLHDHLQKIDLLHAAVDPAKEHADFVSQLCSSHHTSSRLFSKQAARKNRNPGEISSDDESVVGGHTVHLEHSVDANGNPIEFDGEDVLGRGAKVKKKTARTTADKPSMGSLAVNSFIIMKPPDDDKKEKLYVVQVLEINPDPQDPATLVVNNNKTWHYKCGWWEFENVHDVSSKLRKILKPKGICDVVAAGREDEFDWNDEQKVAEISKGRPRWLIQFMDRDQWLEHELAVNIIMVGKKISDTRLSARVLKRLIQECPELKLDSSEPRDGWDTDERVPTDADNNATAGVFADGTASASAMYADSKKRKGVEKRAHAKRKGRKTCGADFAGDAAAEPTDLHACSSDDGLEYPHAANSSASAAAGSCTQLAIVPSRSRAVVSHDSIQGTAVRHRMLSEALARATGRPPRVAPDIELSDKEAESDEDRHPPPSSAYHDFLNRSMRDFEAAAAEGECGIHTGAAAAGGGGSSSSFVASRKKQSPSQCTILAVCRE